MYELATETFNAHEYTPPQIKSEFKHSTSLPNLTMQHTGSDFKEPKPVSAKSDKQPTAELSDHEYLEENTNSTNKTVDIKRFKLKNKSFDLSPPLKL